MDAISSAKAAAFIGAAFVMGIGTIGPALAQGIVGAKACEMYPDVNYALVWYYSANAKKCYVSLRSNAKNPNSADVNVVAGLRGGGGHRHAAGYEVDWLEMGKILG